MKRALVLVLALPALSLADVPIGSPQFLSTTIPLGARARRLVVAPLDAGATPDVAVLTRRVNFEVTLLAYRGVGDGTLEFEDLVLLQQIGYTNTPTLTTADLNGDGWLDLAVAGTDNGQKLFGDGDLSYEPTGAFPTAGGSQHGLDFTDLDGDGDLDSALLVDDIGEWFLDLGVNNGEGLFGGVNFAGAPGSPAEEARLLFADVTGDGRDETFVVGGTGLATSSFPGGPGSNLLLLAGTFGEVLAADFDGDAFVDLAVASPDENGVHVLLNDGTGGFAGSSFFQTGRLPESLAAGDLSGNGHADLAVANRRSHTVSVFEGNGAGGFTLWTSQSVAKDPVDLEAADLEGDGDLDLVVASDGGRALVVLTNQRVP